MKKQMIRALVAVWALGLAACQQDAPPPPNDTVIVDEECPRADHEACR